MGIVLEFDKALCAERSNQLEILVAQITFVGGNFFDVKKLCRFFEQRFEIVRVVFRSFSYFNGGYDVCFDSAYCVRLPPDSLYARIAVFLFPVFGEGVCGKARRIRRKVLFERNERQTADRQHIL